MRPILSIVFFLFAIISTTLASPSDYHKRQSFDGANANLIRRESALDKLKDIRPSNEREKMAPSNNLTTHAKTQSRTKIDPLSVSGAKVVAFIKDGKMPTTGATFAAAKLTTESNNAHLSQKTASTALTSSQVDESCKTVENRKPWSQATKAERKAWLSAVKCTYNQPGRFRYKDIVSSSLADDFGLTHALLNPILHHNPAFLVCHRALVLTWLGELRGKCGYEGDSLYLDLNTYADAGKMLTDMDLWGFDSLGSLTCPAEGKYVDGLKTNYIGNHGQSAAIYNYKHPLCRSKQLRWEDDNMTFEQYLQSAVIKDLWALEDYDNFRLKTEMRLHNAFHACIRRDMYASTSPFDAFLFFGFHLFVDCIYWGWQEKNGGINRLKYDGLHKGTNEAVSVNDMCPMLSLGTNWTVADVLDSREEPGCFTCQKFQPSPF